MPINHRDPVALFLFAHQDDEFGVFALIERERIAGRRVCCVYVTDGCVTANPDQRNAESQAVLQRLCVRKEDILFIGNQLGISDCRLHERVVTLADWLVAFLDRHPRIEAFFVPAWEGGHPDHDLLHAVGVHLLAARGQLSMGRQYPLYHGFGLPGPLFRVLSPLPENGPVEQQVIAWRDRLRYVRFCMSYPSQWRTWIGLFPFVSLRYLFDGIQRLQNLDYTRLCQPPHIGCLYYERRGFLDWPTLRSAVNQLLAVQLSGTKSIYQRERLGQF